MSQLVISAWEQGESGDPSIPTAAAGGECKQRVEAELILSHILFLGLLEIFLQHNRLFSPFLSAFQHTGGNLLSTSG